VVGPWQLRWQRVPQSATIQDVTEPLLFPLPRSVRRLDTGRRHAHPLVEAHDPTLPPQGFTLSVDDDHALLRYADDAGRRYGHQTATQLREDDGTLPTVDMADHPDLVTRGFMLDVSRDRVPTRETLDRLVSVLETCRYNHLQLYIEHTFAYRNHREVWRDASPLDAEDLRWLHDRCRDAGIELAANQNCFGHFGRWLAHDAYRPRAECPDGFELFPGLRLPSGVLAPTVDNADFAVSLAREQVAAFDARIINIGCDETFELGRGVSRDLVARDGLGAVYAEHLKRIVSPLLDDGLEVQFWGDVVAHHPEVLPRLPTDATTALVWNYDAPDTPKVELPESLRGPLAELGIDPSADTHFAGRLAPFADAGVRHWVAPGTSTWNSLVGRIDNARGNLLDAARSALGSGAEGFLVTDWGDGGHHQPLTVSYPPIAYGGAVAWGTEANADLDVTAAIDRYLLDDTAGMLGGVLDRIGRVATRTGVDAVNASPLLAALIPDTLTLQDGAPDPEGLTQVVATLDSALDDLARARPSGAQSAAVVEELSVVIGLTRVAAETMGRGCGLSSTAIEEQVAELDGLIDRYRSAWLMTSRPGGLDDSAAHLVAARDALAADMT